jgi:CHASE2 domain-containing sensor protein
MSKLVVLKIIDGSFKHGFTVMTQLGEEGDRPTVETLGKLPPSPDLPMVYQRWRESYWRLDSRYRISVKRKQTANVSLVSDCVQAAHQLQADLNTWLQSEAFRPIREKWLERLSPDEPIRFIVQTADSQLRQLPWHLLDILERYPKAEFALSTLNTEAPPVPRSPNQAKINILCIIGNSDGIDTQADQGLLAQLPQAQVTTLIEPDRKQVTDELWRETWDILFFAGHSSSQGDRESGRIFLNKTDSLSINELKYAVRKSVERGLQLAIFNSCDGLGLARELADLHIPQLIVMREPVPDPVAQEFLKYFLGAYAQGTPLYLAVREARERLQGMEDRFPCATWLPLICQHPAVTPPRWQDFLPPPVPHPVKPTYAKRTWAIALLCSLVVTGVISGLRSFGLWQFWEFAAFDQMTRLRPAEPPDPRLLVVTIDDEDVRWQSQQDALKGTSISDSNLSRLLTLINAHQPAAIGLDLYRDAPAQNPQLVAQLRDNPNLIAICKIGYDKANPYGTAPPPEIPPESFRVGFSDFVMDTDEVVRRHVLAIAAASQTESRCQVPTAFNLELALRYLQPYIDGQQTGIAKEWDEDLKIQVATNPHQPRVPHAYLNATPPPTTANWQPYAVRFRQLQSQAGVYQSRKTDTAGTQILLNYRATSTPRKVAMSKPLRWFLSSQNSPSSQALKALIQGRVVLIGVSARDRDDFFKTPFGNEMDNRVPGVFLHAHMLSQILSAVLDGRPLLWQASPWMEGLWVGGWAIAAVGLTGFLLQWRPQFAPWVIVIIVVGISTGVLYLVCVGGLVFAGGWFPFIPTLLASALTSAGTAALFTRQSQHLLQ